MWCGGCYREDPGDPYPRQQNPAGSPEEAHDLALDSGDDSLYRAGRNRDHLMGVSFECDLCHFRNMNRWDPVWEKVEDVQTFTAIRGLSWTCSG